jgi:hypothetical protein
MSGSEYMSGLATISSSASFQIRFDKAILSLASAGLGFSLAFLEDFGLRDEAAWLPLRYGSWTALTAAIVVTILSYFSSQQGIEEQMRYAEQYYLHGRGDPNKRGVFACATVYLNYSAGVLFIAGVLATTFFVALNLRRLNDGQRRGIIERAVASGGRTNPDPAEGGKGSVHPEHAARRGGAAGRTSPWVATCAASPTAGAATAGLGWPRRRIVFKQSVIW